MKFSIIVCTKDRPRDLERLLTSLVRQTKPATQVIIVDGSDNPIEFVVEKFERELPIEYILVRPPGLTKQRNVGITLIKPETDWVSFLDDDLVLDSDCFANLQSFINKPDLILKSKLGGVALSIYEQPRPFKSFLKELMLLDLSPGGIITSGGSPAQIRSSDMSIETEWIYGGATFWRSEVFKNYSFDEWFSGVGYFDDVDFSYRVSRKYSLAVCGLAKCHHYHHPVGPEKGRKLGHWLVVAWWYFAREKNKFKTLHVFWAIFCMTLSNLIVGICKLNRTRLNMFLGNLAGIKVALSGQVLGARGFQK